MKNLLSLWQAFWLALFISTLLFLTGVATIPFASQYDALTQNVIYLLGRVPVVFAAIIIYLNLEKKDQCRT